MVSGYFQGTKPLMTLAIGWRENIQDHVAIIDTGFDGDIKLSQEKAEELDLEVLYLHQRIMADGRMSDMPACAAHVLLDGITRTVTVLIAPGETIIGADLFRKFASVLTLNFEDHWITVEHIAQ